jgi:hypothetical protein
MLRMRVVPHGYNWWYYSFKACNFYTQAIDELKKKQLKLKKNEKYAFSTKLRDCQIQGIVDVCPYRSVYETFSAELAC